MKLKHLTISTLALILMTACGDATGVDVDDLAGTWTSTSITLTNVADTSMSVEIVAAESASLTLVLRTDASYTVTFTIPGDEDEVETGIFAVSGTTLTLTETAPPKDTEVYTVVRDGDSMTLTGTDTYEFVQGQGDQVATAVIILTRS